MITSFDLVVIVSAFLYAISITIGLLIGHNDDETWFDYAGELNVIVTHAFVLPCIVISWNTKWYVLVIMVSTVVSVIYHLAQQDALGLGDQEANFHAVDMAYQHVLFTLTGLIVMFKDMPSWGLPFLLLSTTLVASMGDQTILGISIYVWFLGVALLFYWSYLLRRYCHPTNDRSWNQVAVSIIFGCFSIVSFFSTDYLDKKMYNEVHSIWHVMAYGLLYFSLRGLNTTKGTILNPTINIMPSTSLAEKKRRKRIFY